MVAAVMAAEDMGEDLVEVDFTGEVLEDMPLDHSLVEAALAVLTLVDSPVYMEVSAAVAASVVDSVEAIPPIAWGLEDFREALFIVAGNHSRTMLQLDPFADHLLVGRHSTVVDSSAIRRPVLVMDGMVAGPTRIVPTVLGAGMRRGIAMVRLPELSGVG